jgi:H+/gluconate symporter-like permease
MFRKFVCAFAIMVASIGLVCADEFRGKVKSVDADKGTITITSDEKDRTFTVEKDTKIYTTMKGKKKKDPPIEVPVVLGAIKTDAGVTIVTEKKDEKDIVTSIKIDAELKKKKKDQ